MDDRSEEIFRQYDMKIKNTYRARGALLLETNQGLKLFKNFNGSKSKLEFENKMKEGLLGKGLNKIDSYVRNREGQLISEDTLGNKYVIKNWFLGDECNLKEITQIREAGVNLGRMHQMMRKLPLEHVKEYPEHSLLPKIFQRHNRELKRVKGYIRDKKQRNEFEACFLTSFDAFYEQAITATELLEKSAYETLINDTVGEQRICHGSYNYHNILFTGEGVATTNFDKAGIDLQINDLYAFLRKIMEKNNWKMSFARAAIEGYETVLPLKQEEAQMLYILMLYPEKFWKITNFYYNNKKSWISKRNIQKLMAVQEQNTQKFMFLKELKSLTNISL